MWYLVLVEDEENRVIECSSKDALIDELEVRVDANGKIPEDYIAFEGVRYHIEFPKPILTVMTSLSRKKKGS
jgi:hypothetical protein